MDAYIVYAKVIFAWCEKRKKGEGKRNTSHNLGKTSRSTRFSFVSSCPRILEGAIILMRGSSKRSNKKDDCTGQILIMSKKSPEPTIFTHPSWPWNTSSAFFLYFSAFLLYFHFYDIFSALFPIALSHYFLLFPINQFLMSHLRSFR